MPNTPHYEDAVERHFCLAIKQWADKVGVPLVVLKLNLKGRRGWPDRVILWAGGNLRFIEFKRPGERPRKLQELIHRMLRGMGFIVEVYDNGEHAFREIQAQIRTQTPTNEGNDAGRALWWIPTISEAGQGKDGSSAEGIRRPKEEGAGRCPTCHRPPTGDND